MADINSGLYVQWALSMLLKKVMVPADYHSQVRALKQMQMDDVSGLVDSLTDFAVKSASVDYKIETRNDTLNNILEQWLDEINLEYEGKIPMGIDALAEEFFKELWKYSSFPVLRIAGWRQINGVAVPSKMFFVDSESIHAKDKDNAEDMKLINYDYYISSKMDEKHRLDRDTIFCKPYARWFDKYPVPYLIKRGIYHNWRLIQSLKNHEGKILDQVIPYLLMIQKGTEALSIQKDVNYSSEELKELINQFQTLVDEIKDTTLDSKRIKSPIRATQFDEQIKHIIPDLKTIFTPELFAQAERNILSGLGFVDIVEAVSTSRRESVLNPKGFIEDVKGGVKTFKGQILKQLIHKIKIRNMGHNKYMNNKFYICSSPVKAFMTKDFKDVIRQMYDRGRISSQTAVEIIGEVDFQTEVYRREQESKQGIEEIMYPQIIRNDEEKGIDLPNNPDIDEESIPDDKKDKTEREEYDIGKDDLVGAPYDSIKDLPLRIKNNLTPSLQRTFMRVFNKAYDIYKSDEKAFRTAWSAIKKIAKKNADGKWVKKASRLKLSEAIINKILEE